MPRYSCQWRPWGTKHEEHMSSVLIADDNEGLRKGLREALVRERYDVEEAHDGAEALAILQNRHFDVLVTDVRMPGLTGIELLAKVKATDPATVVIIMTAYGNVDMAVEAMKIGAYDFISKPIPSVDAFIITVRKALERRQLVRENQALRQSLSVHYDPSHLIWNSAKMEDIMGLVRKVADTNSTVLITGESGTGKELVAHALHTLSSRASKPLIKVNCAVFSEGLLESELFGHERGAFTGAHARRQGRFEMADGGTIFLDEIGDMPPLVQIKLLRVLQEREFERVGGTVPVNVDVRVLAATKYDLRELIRMVKFREDLYFRLNVVTVSLPSLRERKEDIPLLGQYFVDRYRADSRKAVKGISAESLRVLAGYPWPGNVRELENVVQRALVLADGDMIEPRDLPADIRMGDDALGIGGAELAKTREEQEKATIIEALQLERGNRSRAAARLKMNRTTLLYKMKKHGLIQ